MTLISSLYRSCCSCCDHSKLAGNSTGSTASSSFFFGNMTTFNGLAVVVVVDTVFVMVGMEEDKAGCRCCWDVEVLEEEAAAVVAASTGELPWFVVDCHQNENSQNNTNRTSLIRTTKPTKLPVRSQNTSLWCGIDAEEDDDEEDLRQQNQNTRPIIKTDLSAAPEWQIGLLSKPIWEF